jgi:hypothetical protein
MLRAGDMETLKSAELSEQQHRFIAERGGVMTIFSSSTVVG